MRFGRLLLWLVAPLLPAAELTLQFEPRWQGAPIVFPTSTLTNTHGQQMRLTRFAALVSGVVLLRPDGSMVRLDGQYGFIDAAEGRLEFALRNVPEGDYAGLELHLGVPPEVNHAESGRWPAGHPLNPLVNRLHWGWQGGYVFLALEGRWRAALGEGKETEQGFSYHLANDAQLMTLRFTANYRVARATTVKLAFDVARVLAVRPVAADRETTHSRAGDELAPRLARSVERAVFFLEAGETGSTTTAVAKVKIQSGTGTPLAFTVPAGWPQPELPADNPLTVEGAELGRKLFHDPRLSGNGTQSCASCHVPDRAFSDRVALSRGADGRSGVRNAQPLVNLAWQPAYAWDGGQARVRDQTLAAMTNPIEMHADLALVVADLARHAMIRRDFAAAFGTPEITAERVALALEQFLLIQVSAESKFDRATRGEGTLTEEEQRGFTLFVMESDPVRGQRGADCFHCHGGALFSDFAYRNNGLERLASDRGREKITAQAADAGKFKTPSLRNVALTAPYMHDGRFASLAEVVAHYDHGIQRNAALDPNLAKHPSGGLNLTAEDQHALVAFLKTLTDARFTRPSRPPGPRPPPGGRDPVAAHSSPSQ